MAEVLVRPARTADIKAIRAIIDTYVLGRRLLAKETVTLYETVQEFTIAEFNGEIVGCGALHVLWEDLAEVRTVAVLESMRGKGVGNAIIQNIVERARGIGVERIFCLTFETDFFARNGFAVIEGTPVEAEVYQQLLLSYDEGVAEFLDLERVKPNTLGNTRMLRIL